MAFPIAAAASLGLGALQSINGMIGLNKLNKEAYPKYDISPETEHSYNRAEQMSAYGYSPQEKASFQDSLNRSNNTSFRRGVDMSGGNLAGAINRGINASNIGALNNFAAQDASLHRQNVRYADQVGQGISNQRNLITQAAMRRRDMLEQAYGNATQAGLNNITGSLNLSQALGSGYGSGGGLDYSGAKKGYDLINNMQYSPSAQLNTYGLNELPV